LIAEDNEIELKEGEYVTNIDMVDEDWWMGENARGQSGLFPSNYVELVKDNDSNAPPAASANMDPAPSAPTAGSPGGSKAGPTATALYDYEAAGKPLRKDSLKMIIR
jgi:drebrin-like protein